MPHIILFARIYGIKKMEIALEKSIKSNYLPVVFPVVFSFYH
jgi:hypothetical protein